MSERYKKELGSLLKDLRESRGYTCAKIEELSSETGENISKNYISQVERTIGGRILSKKKFKCLLSILKPEKNLEKELWELYFFSQTPDEVVKYLEDIQEFNKFLELVKAAKTEEEKYTLIGIMGKMNKLHIPNFPENLKR